MACRNLGRARPPESYMDRLPAFEANLFGTVRIVRDEYRIIRKKLTRPHPGGRPNAVAVEQHRIVAEGLANTLARDCRFYRHGHEQASRGCRPIVIAPIEQVLNRSAIIDGAAPLDGRRYRFPYLCDEC